MRMSYLSGIVLLLAGAAEAQDMITLDQAVKEAMEKNLTLAAEKLSIRVAEARQITAALRPNPVLTLDGDYLPVAGTGFSRMNGAGPMEVAARTDFVLERGANGGTGWRWRRPRRRWRNWACKTSCGA